MCSIYLTFISLSLSLSLSLSHFHFFHSLSYHSLSFLFLTFFSVLCLLFSFLFFLVLSVCLCLCLSVCLFVCLLVCLLVCPPSPPPSLPPPPFFLSLVSLNPLPVFSLPFTEPCIFLPCIPSLSLLVLLCIDSNYLFHIFFISNWVLNFGLVFETCLAVLLAYTPGLSTGLRMYALK